MASWRTISLAAIIPMAALGFSAIASGPSGQVSDAPWRISWEERMSLRFNLDDQTRRTRAYASRHQGHEPASQLVVIEGALHPELLTRNELFSHLLATAFPPDPRAQAFWRTTYQNAGLPSSWSPERFWERLAEVAAPILDIRARERKALERSLNEDGPGPPVLSDWELPAPATRCHLRARSLLAARQEFTPDLFDRFLYEAVAPVMTVLSTRNEAELRYLEEGCR